MKAYPISIIMLLLLVCKNVTAMQAETVEASIPSFNTGKPIKTITDSKPLICKAGVVEGQLNSGASSKQFSPVSLGYLNDTVKTTYSTMRNGVISHVTGKVAMSLFNFNVNGFAAKNIASYVSEGTKPFLPFEFANGVKITNVTPKDGTIVYRAEMPIPKNHNYAEPLVAAGKVSASTLICNDSKIVEDLLKREVVIQYDYYDSNGEFFYSFTINV